MLPGERILQYSLGFKKHIINSWSQALLEKLESRLHFLITGNCGNEQNVRS